MKRSREYKHALLIIKSTFCQKVKVLKDQKIHFISNLKQPACARRVRARDFTVVTFDDKPPKIHTF